MNLEPALLARSSAPCDSYSCEGRRAIRPHAAGQAVVSAGSTQGGAGFFKERLILLCKVFAAIDVMYFALFTLALSFDSHAGFFALVEQSFSLETLGEYALFVAIGGACVMRDWSMATLRAFDVALMLGLGFLWSSWCFMHPYPALGAYEMVLALVAAPALRAVLVPSSGLRTFALTAATCAPGLVASFVAARIRHLTMMTPATLGVLVLNWCSISIVFSTVTSSVIYGLRSEVSKARRLGQYTLTAKIGQGGMGVVYLARHALLRRRTVIKLLSPESSTPAAIDRFEREVQLTSQLTHPNTIAIYDFGRTEDGSFYYAMEHLDGMDLEGVVAVTGSCQPARVIHFLRQVCGALEEAHAAGLLHRDIKPSNLFLCPKRGTTDVVKVLDFGLVKELGRSVGSPALTLAGSLVGTPFYMSPELIASPDAVDARSDIYALGAVAYFLLTGRPPFEGGSALEVCSRHLYSEPPPLQMAGAAAPRDLEQVVFRCLEKDPASRFAHVRALRDALDNCAGAGQWGDGDAERWWVEHRDTLEAARSVVSGNSSPPLTVDLAHREPTTGHAWERL